MKISGVEEGGLERDRGGGGGGVGFFIIYRLYALFSTSSSQNNKKKKNETKRKIENVCPSIHYSLFPGGIFY